MYWRTDDKGLPCRVSPFGYLRINGYVLLPEAFRSLSRPSSALSAKASTLRSFCLTIVVIVSLTWCSVTMQRFLGSPHCFLSLYDIKQRFFDVLSISLFLRVLPSDKTRCVGYISYHVCSFQGTIFSGSRRMGLSGLEPPTSRLSGVRSNRLSYKPNCFCF